MTTACLIEFAFDLADLDLLRGIGSPFADALSSSVQTSSTNTVTQKGSIPTAFDDAVGWSNIIAAFVGVITLIVALLSLSAIYRQLKDIKEQSRRDEQVNHSRMMLDLANRWSTVLQHRYTVMQKLADPKRHNIDIETDFLSDVELFMRSKFWREELRAVFNFYEFLGLMIHQGNITREEAFVIVSVDHFDWDAFKPEGHVERENSTYEQGNFYKEIAPYLKLLREYRKDIYVFYDHYLAEAYHANRLQPFLPDHPTKSGEKLIFDKDGNFKWQDSKS